jgi:hypothetical protein
MTVNAMAAGTADASVTSVAVAAALPSLKLIDELHSTCCVLASLEA